jgi:hypothetical protein
MARIRSVHPGLASDEAFMTMSMAAKAAWALLWTECDDHGLFEWKPIVLKARIFPADPVDFAAVLAEYETLGCIKRVEIEGKSYGLIRNFGKFQRPKNPSYRYQWSEEFASYAGFPVVLPQSSPSPTEKPPQMKEEGGRMDKEKEEASASSLAAAAEKKQLDEIASALEDATGWVLPGVHLIRDLVSEGHSLTERVVPLAAESAASRRRLGKSKPESWAYLATIVRDNYREPARASKATKAAQDLVKVPQSSAAWGLAADRYKRERGKPPPVVDGASWFEPRYLATSEAAA